MDVRVEVAPMGVTVKAVEGVIVIYSNDNNAIHLILPALDLSLTPVVSISGHSISAVTPDYNVLEVAASIIR